MLSSVRLTNSFSRKKEVLIPQNTTTVSMYVCGITPYDHAHLGHARCYVTFDTLARLLRFIGYTVKYVRNYTDIDDKIIKRAAEQKLPFNAVANNFIKSYQADMDLLQCLPPTEEPRVTTHIPEIISFIEELITRRHAYEIDGDVYFDISTDNEYGLLSGKNLDDLIAGSRVDINPKKKNPGDFALWKKSEEKYWDSPWGNGRPGWHIECSAMAKKHLGPTVDIHGGGMDLIFPHHENELAQSKGCTKQPLAKIWMHNAFININKEKMSKSLGNAVSLKDLFKTIDPMVLRFYFLQHHYRTPLDFSADEFEGVKTAYNRLCSLKNSAAENTSLKDFTSQNEQHTSPIFLTIIEALCDDLNTSKALGIIFEHLNTIKNTEFLRFFVSAILTQVLGLKLELISSSVEETPEIQSLLQERILARDNKDWARADALREKLKSLGYIVQDKKS